MDIDTLNIMKQNIIEYNAINKSCHTDKHTFFLFEAFDKKSVLKRLRVSVKIWVRR